MTFKIGSKYEETKARLKREILGEAVRIIEGNYPIFKEKGAQCYFCRKHIEGKIMLILEQSDDNLFMVPIDESCLIESQFNLNFN